MVAIVVMVSGMCRSFPYQVKDVDDKGFITESMGEVRMYEQSWRIVAYVNLTDYLTELEQFRCFERQIEGLCEMLKDHPTKACALVPERLKLIINDAESLSELLPNKHQKLRKRRGVLDFVREIQSILFGTLAQSDGRFLNKQIDRLAKNQIQQNDLIKSQTSIIRNTKRNGKESSSTGGAFSNKDKTAGRSNGSDDEGCKR